jgi:hypothetical protein
MVLRAGVKKELVDGWTFFASTLENYLRQLLDVDSGLGTPHAFSHEPSTGSDPLLKIRAGLNITVTYDPAGLLGPLIASTGGGSGLTHPQVMARASLRF